MSNAAKKKAFPKPDKYDIKAKTDLTADELFKLEDKPKKKQMNDYLLGINGASGFELYDLFLQS